MADEPKQTKQERGRRLADLSPDERRFDPADIIADAPLRLDASAIEAAGALEGYKGKQITLADARERVKDFREHVPS